MRKNLIVGILRETKLNEARAPLSPADVAWLKKRFIKVEVESSSQRIFSDQQYKRAGAKIVNRFQKASLLVGIKEPEPAKLKRRKIYMVFSHTTKGQPQNLPLLKTCLKKEVTLVDYEKIAGAEGKRLVYFGKFAGICGAIDSLYYFGKKMAAQGIENPLSMLKPASDYKTLSRAQKGIKKVASAIHRHGFDKRMSPFIVGITGHGNVSSGVLEILKQFGAVDIHPKDIERFVTKRKKSKKDIYQVVFDREEKLRAKDHKGFYFEDYLAMPRKFESNMDVYLPYVSLLFHTSYWDRRFPRLVPKEMLRKIWKKQCRLEFIGDLSCDINGSIQITHRTTTENEPTYTYHPKKRKYTKGYEAEGVTVLARDNLPTELPKDASHDFSLLIREYVYQIAAHGVTDLTNHVALPREIRNAVITQESKLAKPYQYLKKCFR